MITALQAANILIQKSLDGGVYLTFMQIQKILYYLQGWHDVVYGKRLIADDVFAMKNGPVFLKLRDSILGKYGDDDDVKELISDVPDIDEEITSGKERLIVDVKEFYSKYTGKQLSIMTHVEDSPWFQVYVEQENPGGVIPYEIISKHFNTLLEKNQQAQ